MRFLNKILGLAAIGLALVAPLFAQQYQSPIAPIYATNAKYANGVSPGFAPTPGTGLNLFVGQGTSFCNTAIQERSAATATATPLALTPSTTNYVYLDTTNNCLPTVATSNFTSTRIPVAIVITNGTGIASTCGVGASQLCIDDVRGFFFTASGGGSFTAGGDLSGSSSSQRVIGLNSVPFCSGYTPTVGQSIVYTTASSPNPCYTAATASGGANSAQTFQGIPNASEGTTNGLMACWHGSGYGDQGTIRTCPVQGTYGTDNPLPYVGVVTSGGGTTGTSTVQFDGAVSWVCDGTVYTGQQVQLSTTVAGECDCPNGALPGCISPGEHPEATSVFGRVLTGNVGAGTPAIVQLSPFTTSSSLADEDDNFYGAYAMITSGTGTSFLQQSHWQQQPSTFTIPWAWSGFGLAVQHRTHGNGYVLIGNEEHGWSGNDLEIDPFCSACGGYPASTRFDSSYYGVPNIQSGSGGFSVGGIGGNFQAQYVSTTFIWSLTGNSTTYFPVNLNPGVILSFELLQASSGGPYTWTWPSGFVNGPAMCTSSGCSTTTSFFYDGTNLNCISNCSGSGVPNVNGITSAVTLIGDSSITVTPNSPSAGDVQLHATGGGGGGSSYPFTGFTAPSIAGWTWMNQGSGTATVNGGVLTLAATGTGGDNIHYIYESLPSTPWTVIAAVIPGVGVTFPNSQSGWSQGISISDGTKLTSFNVGMAIGSSLQLNAASVTQYNSVTSYNTNSYTISATPFPLVVWLRIKDDGTTRTYSMSSDPTNFGWQQLYSEAHAGFLTPTTVGFSNDYYGTTNTFPGVPFVSFNVTTP